MRIYLQLETWGKLEPYYPILKYLPEKLKKFVAKRWLKPIAIPWNNGPELYILPICQEVGYRYSIEDCIILPQDELNKHNSLITTLLIDILPQLAKLVGIDYEEDILLIKDLESSTDVRFLKQLIAPWRYIVVHGTNKLKIKWWQEFCLRESGQVIQLRENIDDLNISCICSLDTFPNLNQTMIPRLFIATNFNDTKPPAVNIACRFRVGLSDEYPTILNDLYGNYLPPIIIDEWLKTRGICHHTLTNRYDIIRSELGAVNVISWNDDFVCVKIG